MKTRTRDALVSVAVFAAILICGGWPHRAVAVAFSSLYCRAANLAVAHHQFGGRGHARWTSLQDVSARPGDSVAADAVLTLSANGFSGELPLGVSLRRDVYLPWLILVALLMAARLSMRARICALLSTVPLVHLISLAAYGLLVRWTFVTQTTGVYPTSTAGIWVTDFAYGMLLAPPANRFVAPLVLAALIIAWTRRRRWSPDDAVRRRIEPAASVTGACHSTVSSTPR